MSDLRIRLEQLGDRARPAVDAFARLEQVRRRRLRKRRVATAVVALLVATAGSLSAFVAFRGGEPLAGGSEDGFFALWPERTLDDALVAQEEVDAGDPDAQWRLDPQDVALRFATESLGWKNAAMTSLEPLDSGPVDVSIVDVWGSWDIRRQTVVTIDRLVGGDGSGVWTSSGVWSVIAVRSPEFDLRADAGVGVALGQSIPVSTTLVEGTEVAVGVAGTAPCTGFHEQTAEVRDGHLTFPVEGVGIGCAGYLYALTPSTPVGQVELGRIMFVGSGDDKPAIDYTIDSIVAVPVRIIGPIEVEPAPVDPSTADALHVICDQRAIDIEGRAVARPAGVLVEVENATGDALIFNVAPGPEGPWGGMAVPSGTTELALQAPAGSVTVRCSGNDWATDEIEVEVLDPLGLFVPSQLACPGESALAGGIPVSAWQSTDPVPEPIEFVRTHLEGLLPSDVIERAGYPEAIDPVVRLVRDGAVVGSFGIHRQFGEWTLDGTWCSGIDISVRPGPDPYPRGWFQWCPEGPFPEAGREWSERASEAAVRFTLAYVDGDEDTLAEVLDPSVPTGAEFSVVLAEGVLPIVGGTDARGGQIVNYSCGNDVDAYTVAITIDDGSTSASADFTVFLVLREDGWKVWGVY